MKYRIIENIDKYNKEYYYIQYEETFFGKKKWFYKLIKYDWKHKEYLIILYILSFFFIIGFIILAIQISKFNIMKFFNKYQAEDYIEKSEKNKKNKKIKGAKIVSLYDGENFIKGKQLDRINKLNKIIK